jgi:hypothetical protein
VLSGTELKNKNIYIDLVAHEKENENRGKKLCGTPARRASRKKKILNKGKIIINRLSASDHPARDIKKN